MPDCAPRRAVDVVDAEDPRERYSNAVRIGSGASSTIFLADDKRAGHKVALKVTPITDKSKGAIAHEVTVMRENKHANIIELYGCYYMAAASPPEVWIAIEYMDGGALQNVVDIFDQFRLTEQQIAHILWKVRGSVRTSARLRARSSRHTPATRRRCWRWSTNNQIHRDLKSDNVLFNQAGQIKLGDFGSTAKLSRFSERRTTVVGVRAPPPFTRRGVVLHLDPGANSRSS